MSNNDLFISNRSNVGNCYYLSFRNLFIWELTLILLMDLLSIVMHYTMFFNGSMCVLDPMIQKQGRFHADKFQIVTNLISRPTCSNPTNSKPSCSSVLWKYPFWADPTSVHYNVTSNATQNGVKSLADYASTIRQDPVVITRWFFFEDYVPEIRDNFLWHFSSG